MKNQISLQLLNTVKTKKARSKWRRGVLDYTEELLEALDEQIDFEKRAPKSAEELEEMLLCGAESWNAYSYGGCALIYNVDIAKRLCSPSELNRCKNGLRDPNRWENWCDVQARALTQAAQVLKEAFQEVTH